MPQHRFDRIVIAVARPGPRDDDGAVATYGGILARAAVMAAGQLGLNVGRHAHQVKSALLVKLQSEDRGEVEGVSLRRPIDDVRTRSTYIGPNLFTGSDRKSQAVAECRCQFRCAVQ